MECQDERTFPQKFMYEVMSLSFDKKKAQAIDLVFKTFDRLQEDGDFETCDQILLEATEWVGAMMPSVSLSFLTITLASWSELPSWEGYYRAAEAVFLRDCGPERSRNILCGIKRSVQESPLEETN